MCGITGFFSPGTSCRVESMTEAVSAMTAALTHRGPDSGGIWTDTAQGMALGHRRLAIRDLSPAGSQPMCTADARYVLVYNGEIYNIEELRAQLGSAGMDFEGTSDTEVLLKGCAAWGVEHCVPRLTGMFAFALWDAAAARLTLARDRFGVKPLYYGRIGKTWLFASELKALYHHPAWEGHIDNNAVAQYLRYGYIHGPHSLFQGIFKLTPGSLLHVQADGAVHSPLYWDTRSVMLAGQDNLLEGTPSELTDLTHTLLKEAVTQRMIADVPSGAFLSGGIDSSLVVALMQGESMRPVHTFSIGFVEDGYNEAPFAEAVARHLGTEHTQYIMEPRDARELIPRLAAMDDEPLGDASQLPTALLCALARQDVTVALSGDGGDELFAGYGRYFLPQNKLPLTQPFWQALQSLLRHTPEKVLDLMGRYALAQRLYGPLASHGGAPLRGRSQPLQADLPYPLARP